MTPPSADAVRAMYREMVTWAKEEGAHLILAETMYYYEEAKIALEEIQRVGLPAIMNVAVFATGELRDGVTPGEACRRLAEAGAEVVGTNCFRGPATMAPVLNDIATSAPNTPKCAMPVAFRTTHEHPTFFSLPDPNNTAELPPRPDLSRRPGGAAGQPLRDARLRPPRQADSGFQVIGVCCGGSVIHHRAVAEALGREPYLSSYSPDMSKHFMYGDDPTLKKHISSFGGEA